MALDKQIEDIQIEEIWKDVCDYEGIYQVSNLGRIKSLSRQSGFYTKDESILKGFKKSNGYICVDLYKNKTKCKKHVHRLVATAFIPNPDKKLQVNHINENKSDNRVDNLEWVTCKENINFGTKLERQKETYRKNKKTYIPVLQYDINGNFIKEYDGITSDGRELGIFATSITRVCKNKVRTAGNYIWKYKWLVDAEMSSLEEGAANSE